MKALPHLLPVVAWHRADLPEPLPDFYAVHSRHSRRRCARYGLWGDAPGRRSARAVPVAYDARRPDERATSQEQRHDAR